MKYDKWTSQDYIVSKNFALNKLGLPEMIVLGEPLCNTFKLAFDGRPLEGQVRSNVNERSQKISWRMERLRGYEPS